MKHTTEQTRDALTRLRDAYVDAALCETWLALDEARRYEERQKSAAAAAWVQERQRELGREEGE